MAETATRHPCPKCAVICRTAHKLENHIRSSHPELGEKKPRRPSLAEVDATCIECGGEGKLTHGRAVYPHRPDLYHKHFYLCECGAYCGCHPGSVVPLGNPCGPETRQARMAAHNAFDPLWKSGRMTRHSAYAWLAEATGIARDKCHIGMMTAEQARLVFRVVADRRASLRDAALITVAQPNYAALGLGSAEEAEGRN